MVRRHPGRIAALLMVELLALTGCGAGDDDGSTSATTTAVTGAATDSRSTTSAVTSTTAVVTPASAAPTVSASTSAPAPTTASNGSSGPTSSTTGGAVSAAPDCRPDVILAALQAGLGTGDGPGIVDTVVLECANGFARAGAIPDNATCGQNGGSCYETEQVFLRWVDDAWAILTYGTGIDCEVDARETLAEVDGLLEACEALGLRAAT